MNATTQDARRTALVEAAEQKFGFLPNVLKQMAASPAALEAYMQGQAAVGHPGNRLTDHERNLVQLAVSSHFDCHYCAAAHAAIGRGMGSSAAALEAAKAGTDLPAEDGGAHLEATRLLLAKQGFLTGEDLAALEARGIDKEVLYELIASIGVKLISNWINHVAGTEVDAVFVQGA